MSTFSADAQNSAQNAVEARELYLQAQAAAWVIINDQLKEKEGPSERANLIAQASIKRSTPEYWRTTRISVQKFLAASIDQYGIDHQLIIVLDQRVVDQLEEYVRGESRRNWHTPLELLLHDAAAQLAQYDF